MPRLNEILVSRRKDLGLTILELSKRTGISMVSIGKYERGERLPSVDNLNKISKALNLNYNEMFDILLKEKQRRSYGN